MCHFNQENKVVVTSLSYVFFFYFLAPFASLKYMLKIFFKKEHSHSKAGEFIKIGLLLSFCFLIDKEKIHESYTYIIQMAGLEIS